MRKGRELPLILLADTEESVAIAIYRTGLPKIVIDIMIF